MKEGTAQKVSNAVLSGAAGLASFIFSLWAFLTVTSLNAQIVASIAAGAFCLLISYIASERPNSESARALTALGDRLLAVENGDLVSPPPALVRKNMPKLAAAVDTLFAEVRTSIENAHALGMYDPVTSLPNRLHFRSEADKLMAELSPNAHPAMLFIDLDRFKSVNDSLGHARGDQLLIMVANRLRVVVTAELSESSIRRPLLARLAGDEFTLFFPEIRSTAEVERVARRIATAIAEPFELYGHSVDIGASIGVAIGPDHGSTIEALMRAADIAMYRAKSLGGAQHCLFDDDLAAEHQRKVDTERALTDAVQRGEFVMVYQPQLSLISGELVGTEALLRWNHPREGLQSPGSFIPIAESTGLIAEIGEWVLDDIAATLGEWNREGLGRRLAFNVSPRQLDRADFFTRLRHAFIEHGVPLSLVELEFTETAAMKASDAVVAEIAALRRDGVRITIDDFGTGYSNFARLRSLPLDRVKLDQSLISDIEHSDKARVIAQAVMQLIQGIGCEIVAEAVETAAQADILRAMGCHTIQGYVFAEPMPESQYLDWTQDAAPRESRSVA